MISFILWNIMLFLFFATLGRGSTGMIYVRFAKLAAASRFLS